MSTTIYLFGVVISFIILCLEYKNTPKLYKCELSEALCIICLGSLLSWLVVAIYVLKFIANYIDNKNCKK